MKKILLLIFFGLLLNGCSHITSDDVKTLFDSAVDYKYGVGPNTNKQTHCRTTNVGGVVQVFCN